MEKKAVFRKNFAAGQGLSFITWLLLQ